MNIATVELGTEEKSLLLGEKLSESIRESGMPLTVLHLNGELGAGKTTLSRGVLSGFGHQGKVKSPTYTIVEPYTLSKANVFHFDLYRLGDPEELEFMGIRDYFQMPMEGESPVVCLIEWPEKGGGLIPSPQIEVKLTISGLGRVATINVSDASLFDVLSIKLSNSFGV